jgi:hypothetical protein
MEQRFLNANFFQDYMLLDYNLSKISRQFKLTYSLTEMTVKNQAVAWVSELYFIPQSGVFFNLLEDGKVYHKTHIQAIFILGPTSILIVFKNDCTVFHFKQSDEVYSFIRNLRVSWIIADTSCLIQPSAVNYIEVWGDIGFEVSLNNQLSMNFLKILMPLSKPDDHHWYYSLVKSKPSYLPKECYRFQTAI